MMGRARVGDQVIIRYATDPKRSIDQGTGTVIDMERKTDQVLVRWDDPAYGPYLTWEDVEDLEVLS